VARIRRRQPAPRQRAIVAAATALPLRDSRKAAKQAGKRQAWQEDAWTFFDVIPEVKFSMLYLGNAMAKLRLFVGVLPEDGKGDPAPIEDVEGFADVAAIANDELDRLRNSSGGLGEILRELDVNLEVVAECYLVGYGERPETVDATGKVTPARSEDWEVRSIDEVVFEQGQTKVRSSPDERGVPLDPEFDDAIRVYQRHPRWSNLADCNMRAALGDCEALLTLTAQQMAESRSRHNAGILAVPNELTNGAREVENPEDESGQQDPLSKMLVDALVSPVDDPAAAGAVAPIILRGPGEQLGSDRLRWIDLGRKTGDDLEKRIEQRTQRLARALNLPVEKVMGHQQTTYANAAQIDQDEFDDFHEPRATLIVNALTTAFLRPQLIARGLAPERLERVVVWFDPSDLIYQGDPAEVANDAWDRLLLSNDAYRARKGIAEDEAPDEEEQLARTGLRRGIFTADISRTLLEFLGVEVPVTPIPPATPVEVTADDGSTPADDESTSDESDDESSTEAAAARALVLAALVRRAPLDRRAALATVLDQFATRDLLELALRARLADQRPIVASARERSTAGRELMDLDRDLRTRLIVAADAAMAKAMERAGNRLRNRAGNLRELSRNVPPHLVVSHVGPSLVAAAGVDPDELLAGAWDDLQESFMEWGAQSQRAALNIVNRVVGGFDTTTRRALGLRQAEDLEQAWEWLSGTLTSLARGRLFDPTPVIELAGEVASGATIPGGVLRRAIAQAGGAAGLSTNDEGSAFVTLTDGGTRPAGGIGTGDLMREALREHGAVTEAYVWVYGPAARRNPFEPHEELDGVQFENFDDPVLAAEGSFPGTAFYMPGDHAGCLCDFEPIIVGPDGTTTPDTGA
jgi:hypothetical protein